MARANQNEKKKYERYKANKIKEKNKIKKLSKYLKSNPNNLVAHKALQKYQALMK